MKQMKHWQDPVNAVVGAWIALSPWILGFGDHTVAMVNSLVIGLALIAAALGAMILPRAWEEWTEVALGLWLIVSPWALAFAGVQPAMASAVASGLVVMALALWVLSTDKDYDAWLRDRVAH